MSQVTWRWQPFNNPARTDSLALEHWMKCYKDQSGNVRPAEEGEYSFAKFNKKVRCHACLLCYHSLVLSSIHQLTLALGLGRHELSQRAVVCTSCEAPPCLPGCDRPHG